MILLDEICGKLSQGFMAKVYIKSSSTGSPRRSLLLQGSKGPQLRSSLGPGNKDWVGCMERHPTWSLRTLGMRLNLQTTSCTDAPEGTPLFMHTKQV